MQLLRAIFYALLLSVCATAPAQEIGDDQILTGNWTGRTADGIFTQLEVMASGKFVFREQYSSDPRRAYMCGRVTDLGDALSLDVRQMTERLADGAIELAVSPRTLIVDIIARTKDTLIVRIDDRTVVLNPG